MNISDVKIDYSRFEGQDLLEVIFERQELLMEMYKVPKLDLDIPRDQQLIRAMAWSVVEEAGEALEVYYGSKDKEHLGDEIADMMHFYIELLIMSDITVDDLFDDLGVLNTQNYIDTYQPNNTVSNPRIILYERFQSFIVELALAINVLKNRFWRETNLKTDRAKYQMRLRDSITSFFLLVKAMEIQPVDLLDFYLRKNEVNLFRIRSKY